MFNLVILLRVARFGSFQAATTRGWSRVLIAVLTRSPDTLVDITGYDGSSNISSLLPAFKSLKINATLPGLNTTLLKSANLKGGHPLLIVNASH